MVHGPWLLYGPRFWQVLYKHRYMNVYKIYGLECKTFLQNSWLYFVSFVHRHLADVLQLYSNRKPFHIEMELVMVYFAVF